MPLWSSAEHVSEAHSGGVAATFVDVAIGKTFRYAKAITT
jgi:hypothetical protein